MKLRLPRTVVFFGACVLAGALLWAQTATPNNPARTPLSVAWNISRAKADTLAIGIKLTDASGNPHAVTPAEAPGLTIYDESGKKLGEGKFSFG